MVTTVHGFTSVSKIKGAPDMLRMEVLNGRIFSTMIARFDRNVLWLMAPVGSQYKEMNLTAMGRKIPHFFRKDLQITKKKLTEEELDGIPAVKYKATVVDASGRRHTGLLWESREEELPLPLQWFDRENNTRVVWENISRQTLAADQFEVPSHYRRIKQ